MLARGGARRGGLVRGAAALPARRLPSPAARHVEYVARLGQSGGSSPARWEAALLRTLAVADALTPADLARLLQALAAARQADRRVLFSLSGRAVAQGASFSAAEAALSLDAFAQMAVRNAALARALAARLEWKALAAPTLAVVIRARCA